MHVRTTVGYHGETPPKAAANSCGVVEPAKATSERLAQIRETLGTPGECYRPRMAPEVQDGVIQLARMALHGEVELSAIWRDTGVIEYWLRHLTTGGMLRISPTDAHSLSNMMGFGDKTTRIWPGAYR